ncbi:MAG: IPT/TIG domain-containing protein [Candidatus Nomurabacteria bacterium]|nr:IPT/TIG domain-containing protein [Candidatus Nomurabacteria bacterium]
MPVSGAYYRLDVWGASGFQGGLGGYSRGVINSSGMVHVYVGGAGSGTAGGWNGGGAMRSISSDGNNGGGGGATDIRTTAGAWNNTSSLNSRVIVAGGGGGRVAATGSYEVSHGGGTGGSDAVYLWPGTLSARINGGGQTSTGGFPEFNNPGNVACSAGYGGFGIGGNSERASGGGGWYGGSAICYISSGGSGYIGGVGDYNGIGRTTVVGQRSGDGLAVISLLHKLTGSSPASGSILGGNTITISGDYFRHQSSHVIVRAVRIGGTDCVSWSTDDMTITCVAPAHAAGTVDIQVLGEYDSTETLYGAYTYTYPTPSIAGVSPSSGYTAGGNSVTINGANFLNVDGGTTVKFDGVTAGCTYNSSSQMTCTVPARDYSGAVTVSATTAGGTANLANGYTYGYPAPTITSVSPAIGFIVGGQTVTVSGTNFLSSGRTSVTFDGLTASCTFVSSTQVSCVTPQHLTPGKINVVVATGGGSSTLTGGFEYESPTIAMTLSRNNLTITGTIGELWTDNLTVNVKTNNPKGYVLNIEASEPNLKCVDDTKTYTIPAISGTSALDGATGRVNKWGYAKDDGSLSVPSSWTGVTSSTVAIDGLTSSATVADGRNTVVWFGARVNYGQPACDDYVTDVTFTVVGNV